MTTAVSGFLAQVLGVAGASVSVDPAQVGSVGVADCRCSLAVALSDGGDAVAVANPGATASGSPIGAGAGSTGSATSFSVTGSGAATAQATSGRAGDSSAVGRQLLPAAVFDANTADAPALEGNVSQLVTALLGANSQSDALGPSAGSLITSKWAPGQSPDAPVSVEVSFEAGASSSVTSGDTWCQDVTGIHGAQWCAIAVSISLGGNSHASVVPGSLTSSPDSSPASCSFADLTGYSGGAASIAIADGAIASSSAARGSAGVGSCPSTSPVTTGRTGNALSIALTESGIGGASATSGDSGATTNDDATGSGASAASGATGDAVGVAIAKLGAVSVVQSGNSGTASATCTGCNVALSQTGGNAIAIALSGTTGISYSLAVAGLQAAVHSTSGDSGNALAVSTGGAATANGTTGAGTNVNNAPGGGLVVGQSGKTGNTVAVAVGPTTWVTVSTKSGNGGSVTSVVKAPSTPTPTPSATTTAPGGSGTGAQPPAGSDQGVTVGPSTPGDVAVEFGQSTNSPSAAGVIDAIAKSNAARTAGSGVAKHPMKAVSDNSNLELPKLLGPILTGVGFIVLGLLLPIAVVVSYRRRRPG
jgi:hypothetical protein